MSYQSGQQTQIEPTSDVRCKNCHRLLFRQVGRAEAQIEIKCEKCKRICRIKLQVTADYNNMKLPQAA